MDEGRTLRVPGRYEQIRTICEFVSDGAREAGLDEDAIFQVELSCDEACTNIIEHAYGAEDVGDITVTYQFTGDEFKIILRDNGRSFDFDAVPPPSLPGEPAENSTEPPSDEAIQNLQVGGLGIHFMRNLMDDICFSHDEQKGNTLVMIKKVTGRGDQ